MRPMTIFKRWRNPHYPDPRPLTREDREWLARVINDIVVRDFSPWLVDEAGRRAVETVVAELQRGLDHAPILDRLREKKQ